MPHRACGRPRKRQTSCRGQIFTFRARLDGPISIQTRRSFLSPYNDAAVVSPNARWLYTSGTPGIGSSGVAPDGIVAQAELVWQNIFAALKAGGMRPEDLVKTTSYITRRGRGGVREN